MNREYLIETVAKQRFEHCINLMRSKNADYSGGTLREGDEDPFANFRGATIFGIDPIIGILLRTVDKLKRIESFARKGQLQVRSESVQDAFSDVINYMVLAEGMIGERESEKLLNC